MGGGGGGGGGGRGELQERNSYLHTRQKIWISYLQEICRIGQDFLHNSFVRIKFRPILCQICVGNVRKCHVLI